MVSAYQDKLVDNSAPIYAKLKTSLVNTYGNVSFPNFVKRILTQSKSNCKHLKHCMMDRHWKPFISRCAYCTVPYVVISKAETFEEDKRFIGDMAGVQFEDIQAHKSSLKYKLLISCMNCTRWTLRCLVTVQRCIDHVQIIK